MKTSRILLIAIVCIALACNKNEKETIHCTISDYFTYEPISNVTMTFDVASPGIFFGSNVEKSKYMATSDEHGRFSLENVGLDISNRFYARFSIPDEHDSLKAERRYLIMGSNEDSLWIVKNVNHNIRLKPSGITIFHHPFLSNPNASEDSIIVETYYQIDTITRLKPRSKVFYLLPSAKHIVNTNYIINGKSFQKTIDAYISKNYTITTNTTGTTEWRRTSFTQFQIKIPELNAQ